MVLEEVIQTRQQRQDLPVVLVVEQVIIVPAKRQEMAHLAKVLLVVPGISLVVEVMLAAEVVVLMKLAILMEGLRVVMEQHLQYQELQ